MSVLHPSSPKRYGTTTRLSALLENSTRLDKLLFVCIGLTLLAQLHLQFVQKIGWDEFYFLSKIHAYQRGDLTQVLQTFHVHLFGWLTGLPGNERSHIELARVIMFFLQAGTLWFVYHIARTFASTTGSLVAVLAYVSAGFIFLHGTSFRTDPIAAFLILYCIYVVVRSDLRNRDLTGFVLAASLATLVTIKVGFYAPAIVGLGLWRVAAADEPGRLFARLAVTALATLGLFGLLYILHDTALPSGNHTGSKVALTTAWETAIRSQGLFPGARMILAGLPSAFPQSCLLVAGALVAGARLRGEMNGRTVSIAVLLLATPLLSFVFYRNAFPYFFAFIFPSAMVLVAVSFDCLKRREMFATVIVLLMTAGAANQYRVRLAEGQDVQSETLQVVHTMFPRPVKYIDRSSMIASFPKVGFFMSGWVTNNYLQTGIPVIERALEEETVPLLIVNSPLIEDALQGRSHEQTSALLPADVEALRKNFIPHWGHIWVAGMEMVVETSGTSFSILTPGVYTLESQGSIRIDGRAFNPGDAVHLTRSSHIASSPVATEVTLRWGKRLYRPDHAPLNGTIFTGF